jgi:GLPGLI family protein
MKIKLYVVFFVLCSHFVKAQNFHGKAVYKTSRKSSFKISSEKETGIDNKMQEELQKRLQKMNQKTFVLEFSKYTSTYKQDAVLDVPNSQVGKNKAMVFSFGGAGSNDIYYKNIQENRFANQTEIQGKRFLVKDKLEDFKWELSSETKNIGIYTCYKATFSKKVVGSSVTIKRGSSVEDKKKEIISTTVWYTTQIPVSNGPKNYQGLPGLILEVNDGKNRIACTEIILNPLDIVSIQEPEKGKVVSKKKYIKIQGQKAQEIMDHMKGRNGLDMGNGLNVKFGG